MAAETPDRIDIGRLQNLLGRDSESLPVTPQSAERLVPGTPTKHTLSPHTPATYLHTNTYSHDRTGNLRLAYSNSISYSQVDLGETQVDNVTADYEFTQLDGDTTIISEHDEEIVRSTPEPAANLEDTLALDPTPEGDPDESAPAYFPETQRFSSPHIASSPIKKPAGHNPLSHMSLPNAVRRMPISLTQMFNTASSPARPAVSTGGMSLPPTPSAAEATKLLARTLSRMESDLIPGLSSPAAGPKTVIEGEDTDQGSPTQVDPVTVYVSMQQSQEAREKNLRKKFPRRKSVSCSVSPVAFDPSFVRRRKPQDSSAGSDDGMLSSGEERRQRVNSARRKGDDEVKRLFTAAKTSRDQGGLGKSQILNGRGKERARSEEMVKKRVPKRPIGNLRRRQTKSASPPSPEETGDEEDVVVKRTPEISRTNSAPTASSESIPLTADDEDDVALPMNKTHANTSQLRPPELFTSDAPPSPSCEKTQAIDNNGPSAPQTQYTQLLPQDWESLHNPTAANVRRTRSNPVPTDKLPFPVSTIADSQPMPTLTRQKTSLRSLPPFNIPSPGVARPVPEFVQETSGLVPLSDMTSSFTPLQSDASSPVPAHNLQTPFVARQTAAARMRNGATTIPETSPWERGGMVPVGDGGEKGESESPTRKRKRKTQKKPEKEKMQEVVPCSVEEAEKAPVGFAAMNNDAGPLSGRPESDDVGMVGTVADVGTGRDASVLEEMTPTAKRGRRAGKVGSKRARMTPKAADVDELQQQQTDPTAAAAPPEINEPAVVESVPEAPKRAKPALAKTKGRQPSISKPSGSSISKTKPKGFTRKTRSSTGLRNSIGSLADTPTPANTDDDADILTSNNPAFSLSAPAPAPPDPPDASVTTPERVFALFRDGKHSFHPATVLESDVYTGTVKVVFDDGTEDVIERSHVRCLDLRIGDSVKIDLTGMKKAVWEIVGLKHGEADAKLSDCRGYSVVSVKARKSAGATDGDSEVADVLVTNVYLVKSMWKDFNSRVYKDPPGAFRAIRNATPSESFSVRSAPTTPSKSFRPTPMTASFSMSFARPGVGLFAGMVFALSFGDKESVKNAVTYKILQHGGKIVGSSFEELFYDIDRSNPASDSSSDPGMENPMAPVPLSPRPEAERVGFTAVIADSHSRRAKFLQALALGLPCLAVKWIDDCCRKARIIEWEHYLLPAGESKYLGTVKSRMLDGYDARSARLSGVVAGRRRLLEGRSVVVVVGGKGAKVCEKRKPYLFLTYALGALRVAKALTLDAADCILNETEQWDFVYVEAKDRERAERMWVQKGKKNRVRVVDDEWVIQSLILGRLIDDD